MEAILKANHPLLKIAQAQSGLFTSHQAIGAGIDSRNHSYHLKVGNWSKVGKGIYHLNFIPADSKRDFFLFQLWARNRKGEQVGVFSYETALYLMDLRMDYPKKIHITVPHYFRRNVPRDQIILHYEDLNISEKTNINNLYITSAKKTFQDLISYSTYRPEWIKQKLKMAIDKQIISLEEVKKISVHKEVKPIFNAILFEII